MRTSNTNYLSCTGIELKETDKAKLIKLETIEEEELDPPHTGWFPLSQISSKTTDDEGVETFLIAEWILEKKELL